MIRWIEKSEPAAESQVHLMLAGVMWALVGAVLVAFGSPWLWQSSTPATPWLFGLALAIGAFKARFVWLFDTLPRFRFLSENQAGSRSRGSFLNPISRFPEPF